ncbi:pre-mRNA-splicing factor CWC22 homolog isoform X2 [Saccostrea cucullata]|uniref:pre-mRNA-splicing factor CWC22 homolog isoform X2 n=1 Tax=Saccostrea cuccullata TaxID=36930 RepID=UPI002ED58BA1
MASMDDKWMFWSLLTFCLIQATLSQNGVVSNNVADTAGGGVGTGAIIGIAVGVVAFLIIIIAVVCFFVCRQMAQQKEEKMRQLQPSVFTTASSRQATAPSAPHLSTSGSQHGRQGSTRTSQRTKTSHAFENKAFSDTSNVSTEFVGSKVSYAIISDGSVDGKSSIRMQNLQRSGRTGSVRRDKSVPDKGLSDDARSSVKFDLRSDSELGRINRPLQGDSSKNKMEKNTTPKEFIRTTNGKQNDSPKTVDRKPEKATEKPKKSTTEGKDYFREYTNKGYDGDLCRSGSVRKPKYKETSSSSHNSSNSNRHLHENRERNDVRRSRSKSESRYERDRYRDSESDDFYKEQRQRSKTGERSHRRNSIDRSHRRSDSRSRRRDDYYSDRESDSDDFYRERNRRSRSADRRGNQEGSVRRSNSRSRSRGNYYDDYRSDDSFIRSDRYRDGYKSDNRYDNRSTYRRDKRDGYRSDNRYDYRDEYRRDNRYDHRERLDSFKDRERRNQRTSYDYSDGHRSRATSVGSAYSKQRSSSRSRYDRY